MVIWHEHVEEIQEQFFRQGTGTCLVIRAERVSACLPDAWHVHWKFMFLDYGACHTVSGCSLVERAGGGCDFYVDERYSTRLDEAGARDAVFGGHYVKCMAEVNEDFGVET